jgi:hypothetical protein
LIPETAGFPERSILRDNRSRLDGNKRTEVIEPRRNFPDGSVDPTEARTGAPADFAVSPAFGDALLAGN